MLGRRVGIGRLWIGRTLAAAGIAVVATGGPGTRACIAEQAAGPSRVLVDMNVRGDLFAPAEVDAEPLRQPITLDARFEFVEQPAAAAGAGRVTRRYATAAAVIETGSAAPADTAAEEPRSRAVRLLAADAGDVLVTLEGTTAVSYLAEGFLTREEAELLDTPFDPLLLDGLRPQAAVAVGDTWTVPGDLVAGLVAIDTVESGGLKATLEALEDGRATLRFSGTIVGGVDGVPTRLEVEGTARADLPAGEAAETWSRTARVTLLKATISERREAGWVSPGLAVEATISMRRLPLDEEPTAAETAAMQTPPRLAPARVDRPVGTGRPGVIWHRHPEGRYAVVLDRRWRVVEDGPEGLVMRLVDRGALVAQCSVLPLPRAAAAAPPSEEAVQADVRRSLGEQFGHLVESEATAREDGTRIVRVVADGAAAGRPFRWIHHVLTGPGGHTAAVTFMLEPALSDRFAAADRELVAGMVVLPDPAPRAAALGGEAPR